MSGHSHNHCYRLYRFSCLFLETFPMGYYSRFLVLCLVVWTFLFLGSHQLQPSQTQVLLQIRKHLEYPSVLEIWKDHTVDFCFMPWNPQVNISCQDNFVTELRILGDKPVKVGNFNGFPVGNHTLSTSFSMDSFVATLARLTSLRVLSLVSLGIWGPLPDKIDRLYSLEYLDLSSNYLFGSVPPKISTMAKLQTLILDDNFFNETIPNWFDSLTNLAVLYLKNNQLKGPFPSSVVRITTLTDLILSGNMLSGEVPSLDDLSSLHVIDLSRNKFDSSVPSMPEGLVLAYLSNNSFSGEIPREFSKLTQLQHLDLSFNQLSGTLPASLFSFPNISYLNLASNVLGGSISDLLHCGGKLTLVDISNNRLTGGLPHCLSSQGDKKVVKFDGNCLSIDLNHQDAESSCVDVPNKGNHKGRHLGILVGLVACIVLVVLLLAFVFLVICRRCCSRAISDQHLLHKAAAQENSATGFSEALSRARYISQTAKLDSQLPPCRSFTLEELKEATNNFDSSAIVGEGSYGKLYKGRLENGILVAVRCLPTSKKYSIRNLKLRLDLLSKLRHPQLVCLLGHCIDCGPNDYRVNKVFLIYEYVSSGNFRHCLSADGSGKVLNWSERLAALIGVAKAVHFLHTGVIPGFFHNRLKANNILLNMQGVAKLSDYGLSIVSEDALDSKDTEDGRKSWQMSRLEDDVYSFGMILLESIVGPPESAKKDRLVLDELASSTSHSIREKLVNPNVLATASQDSLSTAISIAHKCITIESWSRPSFEDILWNLQYAAQVQGTAEGEQRFSNASPSSR